MQVAACELLHSLVVYMVGKSAQMVEGEKGSPPMYKLHKRLFPVLLRLACDVDQVFTIYYDSDPGPKFPFKKIMTNKPGRKNICSLCIMVDVVYMIISTTMFLKFNLFLPGD